MNKCLWCDTDISGKRADAKFCSPGHKLNFNRKQKIDEALVEKGLPPTVQASKIESPPPKEDAPFETLPDIPTGRPEPGSPEWYVHGTQNDPNKTWNKVCVRCGEKFTTSLELMRFCSDRCKSEVMVVIANGAHKNYIKWIGGENAN